MHAPCGPCILSLVHSADEGMQHQCQMQTCWSNLMILLHILYTWLIFQLALPCVSHLLVPLESVCSWSACAAVLLTKLMQTKKQPIFTLYSHFFQTVHTVELDILPQRKTTGACYCKHRVQVVAPIDRGQSVLYGADWSLASDNRAHCPGDGKALSQSGGVSSSVAGTGHTGGSMWSCDVFHEK